MMLYNKKIIKTLLLSMSLSIGLTCVNSSAASAAPIYDVQKVVNFEHDEKEALKWGGITYQEWFDKLITFEEKSALIHYTDEGYRDISKYLREKNGILQSDSKFLTLNKTINDIDSALKKGEISEPMIVYRRVGIKSLGLQGIELKDEKNKIIKENLSKVSERLIGKTRTEYGYLSTALIIDPEETGTLRADPILMKITLPSGTNAAYLGGLSKYPEEQELLVGRNTTYKIEKVSLVVLEDREYLEVDAKVINQK